MAWRLTERKFGMLPGTNPEGAFPRAASAPRREGHRQPKV